MPPYFLVSNHDGFDFIYIVIYWDDSTKLRKYNLIFFSLCVIYKYSFKNASKESKNHFRNSIQFGSIFRYERVAETVGWLPSNHSSYIEVVIVPVSKGRDV